MDQNTIKAKVAQIASKRDYLIKLLEMPNLGTLKVDVDQALDELDELLDEFAKTFPEN